MWFIATSTINCRKEHKCVGCGGTYRYKITRKAQGNGNIASNARAVAERVAIRRVQGDAVERPCPHCGCIQADMIGQAKANAHLWCTGTGVLVAPVLLVMAAIPSATWMPYSRAASILGGISLVILLAHLSVALKNPNANKAKNREKAEKLVEANDMQAVSKPSEERVEGDPSTVAYGVKFWLVVATLGFLLILAPVLLKTVNGWKSNDGLKPEVVGLGDTVRFSFDTRIDCVQGLWSGGARAGTTVDGRWVPLPTVTQTSDWEVQMSVKSGERHTSPVLWADVMVPSDPALAGQTLALTVSMPVRFPTMGGGNAFDDQVAQATLNRDLYVSAAGARQVYWLTFWAMVGGSVLLALAGVMLSRGAAALKAAAPDTRVTPIRETDEESADYRRRGEDDEDDRPRRRRAADDDEGDWWK